MDGAMSTPFAEACHRPFSNGTEGDAWMNCWCNYCARDHSMHADNGEGGCDLILAAMFGDDDWPEGWIPEPDDDRFFLPSRLICTAFTPCEPCGGDPGADDRGERVAEVTAYWKDRR
jgi:hypothetical protein